MNNLLASVVSLTSISRQCETHNSRIVFNLLANKISQRRLPAQARPVSVPLTPYDCRSLLRGS